LSLCGLVFLSETVRDELPASEPHLPALSLVEGRPSACPACPEPVEGSKPKVLSLVEGQSASKGVKAFNASTQVMVERILWMISVVEVPG